MWNDYEEDQPKLNPVQQQFVTLLHQASLLNNTDLEDNSLLSIKAFLDNPETEQHIHIQQLKLYNLFPYNGKIYSYLKEQFVAHHDNIKLSIANNNIDFIRNHFTCWFQNKSEAFQYSEDKYDEMINLFQLASEKNATNVIKFFLTDKELLSQFNSYIYSKELLYEALDKAFYSNNIELTHFLTQSPAIDNNPSIAYKITTDLCTEKFSNFVRKQNADIKKISDEFENFANISNVFCMQDIATIFNGIFQHNDVPVFTFNDFIEKLEVFLNSDLLKGFDVEYKKGIQHLFYHATTQNNVQLLEYTLQSKSLNYHADSLDKGEFTSYLKACENNAVAAVETLLPIMYSAYLKKNSINKDLPFVINSEGLDTACKKHFNELVKIILNFDKAEEINFNTAFYNACGSANFDIIPFIIRKSLKDSPVYKVVNSPILDEYPYYNVMLSLFSTDMLGNNYLTPEKQIEIIDYLFNEPLLNPQNYPNYQSHNRENLTFSEVFQRTFLNANIEVMDYFISSDNSLISSQLNGFINENLIKAVFSQSISSNNMKKLVNYLIIEADIKRSEELYNFLRDIIVNYGNGTQKEQMYKKVAEYTMDLYDTKEFNAKLNQSIEKATSNKNILNKNKKKI